MEQRSIEDVLVELLDHAYNDGWCDTDTFSQATLACLARALQLLTKQNNHEPVSSVPKPEPLGTVDSLFDEMVIEHLGLDRAADVYLAPVPTEPVNAQLLEAAKQLVEAIKFTPMGVLGITKLSALEAEINAAIR